MRKTRNTGETGWRARVPLMARIRRSVVRTCAHITWRTGTKSLRACGRNEPPAPSNRRIPGSRAQADSSGCMEYRLRITRPCSRGRAAPARSASDPGYRCAWIIATSPDGCAVCSVAVATRRSVACGTIRAWRRRRWPISGRPRVLRAAGALWRGRRGRAWFAHPHREQPGHPEGPKIQRQEHDEARIGAPLVLDEEPDEIGDDIAGEHEADEVDDERHDSLLCRLAPSLRKSSASPGGRAGLAFGRICARSAETAIPLFGKVE